MDLTERIAEMLRRGLAPSLDAVVIHVTLDPGVDALGDPEATLDVRLAVRGEVDPPAGAVEIAASEFLVRSERLRIWETAGWSISPPTTDWLEQARRERLLRRVGPFASVYEVARQMRALGFVGQFTVHFGETSIEVSLPRTAEPCADRRATPRAGRPHRRAIKPAERRA